MRRGAVGSSIGHLSQHRHGTNQRLEHLRKVTCTLALVVGIACISAVGGYLNRARGGAVTPVGGYWSRHILARAMVGLPTGAIVGLFALSWRPFPVVATVTSVSLIIGWGCYFDVTTQEHGWSSRQGIFDWLIGREEEGWPQYRVFYHNYAGMALRGLAWTSPQGYILYHMGYGWQFSVTGCLMSAPYSFGWYMHSYSWMARGQPWCETVWGYYIWVVMITVAMAGLLERLRENSRTGHTRHVPYYLSSYISNWWLAVLFEVWTAAITVIFLGSLVFYSMVQQLDVKNKAQTFFGMYFVTMVQLAAQVVIYTAIWLTKRKDIDLTYDLRGVAILCQSPLIMRNKVQFSPSRFRSRQLSESTTDHQFQPYQHGLAVDEQLAKRTAAGNASSEHNRLLGSLQHSSGGPGGSGEDDSQDDITTSSDSESDEVVDWSMILSQPSSNVLIQLRKLPYRVWLVAETNIYTSFPAMLRLLLGALALLGCLLAFYITTSAMLWNLHAPRYLHVCNCTQ
ncbi:uncharacterized protein LOC135823176 [Sycon ciliatum]|uniref:uncharacterized protein LOC135823176 n=1 Tax=Sycon ciliatum TaxID=27933 RepID=UPI0020A90E38|eukprot:scpid45365/ scgid34200/ 